MKITNKKRIEFMKSKLSNDCVWAVKAMLRIYENQTSDEQINENVTHKNDVGFTSFDAEIMTSFVKRYQSNSESKFPRPIAQLYTMKQLMVIMKIMPKYAGQLLRTKTDIEKLDKMIEAQG